MTRHIEPRHYSAIGRVFIGGALILASLVSSVAMSAEFPVTRQLVEDKKLVFATVESVDLTQARARIGGTVSALSVDEGDQVNAGDVIAMVKDEKLPLEFSAIDAQVSATQIQRDTAEAELRRVKELKSRGTVSQARLDEASAAFSAAEGQLKALIAQRQVVRQRLKEGEVKSPGDGRVLHVLVTRGAVIQPGEVVATIAAERYILRLRLPERHARFMHVGDEIIAGRGALTGTSADNERRGKITKVYPQLEQGRVIADAEIDGLGSFFVGERVPVHIATGEREAILLPTDAIYQRHGISYVRLKDGAEVTVQTGLVLGGKQEILSGLRIGDVVVTP